MLEFASVGARDHYWPAEGVASEAGKAFVAAWMKQWERWHKRVEPEPLLLSTGLWASEYQERSDLCLTQTRRQSHDR